MGVATYGTSAPLPVGVHGHNRTQPHLNRISSGRSWGQTSEMCAFNNQSGVWATSLLLHGVCWHRAFAAKVILEPVILSGSPGTKYAALIPVKWIWWVLFLPLSGMEGVFNTETSSAVWRRRRWHSVRPLGWGKQSHVNDGCESVAFKFLPSDHFRFRRSDQIFYF